MDQQIQQNGFAFLPITLPHTSVVTSLPFYHRDPFDRLLIAQAMAEGIPIISNDGAFAAYPVNQIW